MFSSDVLMMFAEGIRDTLYMTLVSTAFAYLLGLPIAILLVVTRKNGLHPMPALFGIFDFVVNILRSVPFLILMLLVTPLMRLIAGKAYGPTATIVALVIAAGALCGPYGGIFSAGGGFRGHRSGSEHGRFFKNNYSEGYYS